MLNDPEFLAACEKRNLMVDGAPGEEIDQIVRDTIREALMASRPVSSIPLPPSSPTLEEAASSTRQASELPLQRAAALPFSVIDLSPPIANIYPIAELALVGCSLPVHVLHCVWLC